MNIMVIRLFDNDLRRKVYMFNVSLGIGSEGIKVHLDTFREERRLSRRHRNWMQLARWDRRRNRDNTLPAPPEVPDDVAKEVIDTITHKIIISNP